MLCSTPRPSRSLQHGSGVFPHAALWRADPGAAWFPKDFFLLLGQMSLSTSFLFSKHPHSLLSSLPLYGLLKGKGSHPTQHGGVTKLSPADRATSWSYLGAGRKHARQSLASGQTPFVEYLPQAPAHWGCQGEGGQSRGELRGACDQQRNPYLGREQGWSSPCDPQGPTQGPPNPQRAGQQPREGDRAASSPPCAPRRQAQRPTIPPNAPAPGTPRPHRGGRSSP